MKAIKFTKAALEKLKQTDHTYRVQDDQTVGLSIEVRATPSTLKVFYAEWSNIVIDKNGKQKRWGSRRKVCRYGQKPIEAVKKVVNANLDEWKKDTSQSSSKGGQVPSQNMVKRVNVSMLIISIYVFNSYA